MAFETIDVQENGNGQFLQIPNDFKIDDAQVFLKKVNGVLYVIPLHNPWQPFFNSIQNFSEDFMEERNQPIDNQIRESLD